MVMFLSSSSTEESHIHFLRIWKHNALSDNVVALTVFINPCPLLLEWTLCWVHSLYLQAEDTDPSGPSGSPWLSYKWSCPASKAQNRNPKNRRLHLTGYSSLNSWASIFSTNLIAESLHHKMHLVLVFFMAYVPSWDWNMKQNIFL